MDTTLQLHVSPSDVEHYCTRLRACGAGHLRTAVLGKSSKGWASAIVAAGLCNAMILPLDETLQIHQYKRVLNQYHCNCLIYPPEFDELVYMLKNTGTTTISCYIRLREAADATGQDD